MIYLDSNILLYATDSTNSQYKREIRQLIKHCSKQKISIATSIITLQEVIHYCRRQKELRRAIKIIETTKKLKFKELPIPSDILNPLLKLVNKHKDVKIETLDLLHIAICKKYNIPTIVTYDKAFTKINEITSHTPSSFLNQ